jgi:hypothetical protein
MSNNSVPTLENRAFSGALEGMVSGRALNRASSLITGSVRDFATITTAANTFATELSALIVAGAGQFAAPTNVQALTSASGVTEVVAAHLPANAAETLPPVLGAMCKAAFEYRSALPTEPIPEGGAAFDSTDYGPIASACLALFYAFAGSALYDYDTLTTVNNPVLYNCAAGGFLAGVFSQRLSTLDQVYEPIEPSDFAAAVAAAFAFAAEVDAAITAASGVPTNVTSLTTTFESVAVTVVPASAAVQNAAYSLPGAMVYICKAAWENRGYPAANPVTGAIFAASDYADTANTCVAEFLEYAANTTNT